MHVFTYLLTYLQTRKLKLDYLANLADLKQTDSDTMQYFKPLKGNDVNWLHLAIEV